MDPWEVAQAQVATKYDPQQTALQRNLDLAKQSTITNEQAIQGYGTTGRNIIGETYNKLYDWLNYGKASQQQELGQAVNATQQGYQQAIGNIQGYQQKSRDYLTNMAQQLGQSGMAPQINSEVEGIINSQLARAEAAKQNYGGSLSEWVTKMGNIADMGISSAHQGEAQGRTEFETTLLDMLGQNKLAGTTQETDLMNKLSDIMGLRQSDLITMYNELAAAEWERQFKQAQLAQEASIAQAQLDAAAAEGAANRAASAKSSGSNDALGWAKLQEDIREFGLENALNIRKQDFAEQPGAPDYTQYGNTIAGSENYGDDLEMVNAAYTGGPNAVQALMAARNAPKPGGSGGGGSGWGGLSAVPKSLDWLGRATVGTGKGLGGGVVDMGRQLSKDLFNWKW